MGCLNSWYKCMMGKEDTDHFQISVTEVTSRKITATLSSLFIDVIVFLHRDFRFLVSFSFCYFFLFHFGLFFFAVVIFYGKWYHGGIWRIDFVSAQRNGLINHFEKERKKWKFDWSMGWRRACTKGDSGRQRNWIIERIKKVEEVTELCSGNGDWWSDGAICADAADWDQFHQAMLGQVLHWRQPDYAASAGIGQWFHRFSQTARRQE